MLPDRKICDSEEAAEEKEEGKTSSYFQGEAGEKREENKTELEINNRRKRWARPPVVGGGSGSGSESEEASRVSPTSSVASLRPLEWDSGADVGYSCYPPDGRERREPEGRTREVENKIGAPTAESTPKYPLFPEVIRGSNSGGEESRPPLRPSNSSSSVNTVVTNSDNRAQEGGARSNSVEWVSVEGEAERGVEALVNLIEGRDPALAHAILQRVFARIITLQSPQMHDKCIGTGDVSTSVNLKSCLKSDSTTETSSEKRGCSSSSVSENTDHSENLRRVLVEKSEDKQFSGGRRWERRTEWKRAATAAERLREAQHDTSSESVDERKLAELVNCERKTQLEWIRSEIKHLSSLQALLERHEELKRNVNKLKRHNNHRRGSPPAVPQLEGFRSPSQQESGWSSHHYCESDSNSAQPLPRTSVRVVNKKIGTHTQEETSIGVQTSPKSLAYDITFPPQQAKHEARMVSLEELHAALDQILRPTTLQGELLDKRPEIVERVEERRKIVQELVALREERAAKKRHILASGSCSSPLPPPPLAVKRVMNAEDRRKRKPNKGKEEGKRKEEAHRTNRLMAQIFNRKLQARTLRGEVDLSNSTSVISSL